MAKRRKPVLRVNRASTPPREASWRPWAFSLGVHACLVLAFTLTLGWQKAPPADAQPIELVDLPVDRPLGDRHGPADEAPAPKDEAHVVSPVDAPVPDAPPEPQQAERPEPPVAPDARVDLDALLAQRQERARARELARVGELASSSAAPTLPEPGLRPAGPTGGVSGTGLGMTGDIGQRRILDRPAPEYPPMARRTGVEGDVRLRVWVGPEGGVDRVEVVEVSGTPEMDRRAIDALKHWRFAPLPAGVAPVTQWGEITLRFRLDQ